MVSLVSGVPPPMDAFSQGRLLKLNLSLFMKTNLVRLGSFPLQS